ncbi:MAG: zinc ribbon domain-containing protein [Clostridia bacterium]|nr:zinc ribbon domain-containing protein [Clostridia bacterium]
MFCTNCGNEINDNAVICTKCGVATQNFGINNKAAELKKESNTLSSVLFCRFSCRLRDLFAVLSDISVVKTTGLKVKISPLREL